MATYRLYCARHHSSPAPGGGVSYFARTTLLFILAILPSCNSSPSAAPAAASLTIVTTSPTIAEIISEIGGSGIAVQSLNPKRSNPLVTLITAESLPMLLKAQLFVHAGFTPVGKTEDVTEFQRALDRWRNEKNVVDISLPDLSDSAEDPWSGQQLPWLYLEGLDRTIERIGQVLDAAVVTAPGTFRAQALILRKKLAKDFTFDVPQEALDPNDCIITHQAWIPLLEFFNVPPTSLRLLSRAELTSDNPLALVGLCRKVIAITPSWPPASTQWRKSVPHLPFCWESGDRPPCSTVADLLRTNLGLLRKSLSTAGARNAPQ